jgi:hypothetical protein
MTTTGGFRGVPGQPILRISRADLDNLMTTLDVSFVKLAECLVSPGWRLVLSHTDAPGIHYSLSGTGRMIIGDHPPIDLVPHTLIIAPRGLPVQFEHRQRREVHRSKPWMDVGTSLSLTHCVGS